MDCVGALVHVHHTEVRRTRVERAAIQYRVRVWVCGEKEIYSRSRERFTTSWEVVEWNETSEQSSLRMIITIQ